MRQTGTFLKNCYEFTIFCEIKCLFFDFDYVGPCGKSQRNIFKVISFKYHCSVQVEKFVEKNEEESLSLAPCSAFQRKLTYQAVNAKYAYKLLLY